MSFGIHNSLIINHFNHNGCAMWATMLIKKLVNFVNMDNYILKKTIDVLVIMDMFKWT